MREDIMNTELFDESQERQIRALLARAMIYRLLALALSYPTKECVEAFRSGWEEVSPLVQDLGEGLSPMLGEMGETLKTYSREQWEAEYVRVFTHIFAPDAQPCETAYTAKNLFQLSDQLSRLMRFYQAFGVQPHQERPDHIAVELHFMGFLVIREAQALLNGNLEHAETFRCASQTFFQDHLKKYALTFVRALREKGAETYLAVVSSVLEAWVRTEAERLNSLEGLGDTSPVFSRNLRILQESHEVVP
jgi:DMSO reductase family type II enzyme chaperone